MGLLSRVKNRVKRALAEPQAPAREVAWSHALSELWSELREQYAVAWQTMASATVASWEVVAAELHRAAHAKFGAERATRMVERFSDSLVPTLSPIQATERGTSAVWKDGMRKAGASGRFEDALAGLRDQAGKLGGELAAAWPKTVDYLGPVLDDLGVDDAGRARLGRVGQALQASLDGRAAAFVADLDRLPRAADIEKAFLDAVETFRHAAAQDIEVALDNVRAVLIEAARR